MVRKDENKVPAMQPEDLAKKLVAANIELFEERSGFPLNQAQRNLEGRTHYVEDATLRAHVSKIHSVQVLDEGLILGLVESVQAGPAESDGRVFRPVFFDVFGTTLYRPSIDDSFNTLKQAQSEFWKQADQLDAVQATIEGMDRKRKDLEKALDDFDKLMEEIKE
jgi:hypothetical protein